MTLRVFRNYWQRPMAVLAGMEFLVFAAALCLISLPHFDGESPLTEPRLAEVLTRAFLFAPVLSISMVATGLYNERQAFALGGLLTRIVVSTLGGMLVGFTTGGFVPAVGDEPSAVSTERRIELRSSLLEHCRGHEVTEIVVAMDDGRAGFPFEAFLECRLAGIAVSDLTEFLERET